MPSISGGGGGVEPQNGVEGAGSLQGGAGREKEGRKRVTQGGGNQEIVENFVTYNV